MQLSHTDLLPGATGTLRIIERIAQGLPYLVKADGAWMHLSIQVIQETRESLDEALAGPRLCTRMPNAQPGARAFNGSGPPRGGCGGTRRCCWHTCVC